MKEDVKSKFSSFMKGAAPAEDDSEPMDDSSEDESSPMYDLACKLCDALGVSEDKADKVTEVLMDLKDHMSGESEEPAEE